MAPAKPPVKSLPKWAWPAAIAGGLVIGFVFLRKNDSGGAPAEVVGQLGDGSAQYPAQQAAQGGGTDMSSVLGALGLLGDQIGALQGSMQQYYGSGGTSQSGGASDSGGGVVEQAQAESQASAYTPAQSAQLASQPMGTDLDYVAPAPAPAPAPWADSPIAERNTSGAANPAFTVTGGASGAQGGAGGQVSGVQWGGQTWYSRAGLSGWLSAHGANWATWAANHPAAAAKLS